MHRKQKNKHIHLVGIGGAGLSAIARVLLGRGFHVSGSDLQLTQTTADLYNEGATIFKGHRATNIAGAQMLIVSSAIPPDNPELQAARQEGVPILKRADLLGSLMTHNVGIAVAGTHGKTTTAGMIAQILLKAQADPTVIIGGHLPKMASNGRAGKGAHFVLEADEYDQMFLGLRPKISVITNIDYDHPDSYPSPQLYQRAFQAFAQLLPDGGCLVVCAEDARAMETLMISGRFTRIAYGLGAPVIAIPGLTVISGQELRANEWGGTDFIVKRNVETLGAIRLRVPGKHNVNNALAATAVALHEDIPFETIAQALAEFAGVGRRFELLGQVGDVIAIDDYAHHPTAIRSTLVAARQRYPNHAIRAVWQPHTYSRINALQQEFNRCFADADQVIVLDVYGSREQDAQGLTGAQIASQIEHPHVQYIGSLSAATAYLLEQVQPHEVVITLNAGDARLVGKALLEGLRGRIAATAQLEDKMSENDKQKQGQQSQDDDKMFKLDATVSQVQRLVDRLKDEQQPPQTSEQDGS